MELTFLSEFRGDRQVLRVVDGAGEPFHLAAGASVPLESGYCARVARGTLPSAVGDVRADPLARDLDLTGDAGVGAYIGVPVRLADGTLYGSLCGLSRGRADIHERDVRFLQVLAAIIADELSLNRERDAARRRHAEEIAAALGAESLDMAFQPIVRLADHKLFAFEALARFDGREPRYATDAWFAAAWEIGVGADFELLAMRSALRALDRLPAGAFLCINADPRTITSSAFIDALAECGPAARRLIVELTEHSSVTAYEPLQEAMAGAAEPRRALRGRRRRRGLRGPEPHDAAGSRGHQARPLPHRGRRRRPRAPGAHLVGGRLRRRHPDARDRGGDRERGRARGAAGRGHPLRAGLPSRAADGAGGRGAVRPGASSNCALRKSEWSASGAVAGSRARYVARCRSPKKALSSSA